MSQLHQKKNIIIILFKFTEIKAAAAYIWTNSNEDVFIM